VEDAARPHTFHIPVMGTAFTIDTPLRVARFGIASAISLVDDELIERVRERWCRRAGVPYEPIGPGEEDARARRITRYLDLVDQLVALQIETLRSSSIEPGSELARYFEMLPDGPTRRTYLRLRRSADAEERRRLEHALRWAVAPGAVDVNVMTKVDRAVDARGRPRPSHQSDALAALRGFANSTLHSSVVFSAGLNARLYTYAGTLPAFLPDEDGRLRKRVILKVGSYRSAEVQMRFLAKRGVWVSELRLESALNCGGHAFPAEGKLLGPVLEELVRRRRELAERIFPVYNAAIAKRQLPPLDAPPDVRVTAQGGIGTATEDALLRERYGADGTGWGTPFLLVPEATCVDPETLRRLVESEADDVHLSDSSPLGVPFWTLRTSASEEARRARIARGRPGSACPKGYLATRTDLSPVPVCTASRGYQRRMLAHLETSDAPESDALAVVGKSCICNDLGGSAAIEHGFDPDATPAVCPGPNIASFDRIATLDEMVDHIHGRRDPLPARDRPHVLVRELQLWVDHLCGRLASGDMEPDAFATLRSDLLDGVDHYVALAREGAVEPRDRFLDALERARAELTALPAPTDGAPAAPQ